MFGFRLSKKPGKSADEIQQEKQQAEDNSRDMANEWGIEPVRPHIALQLACAQGQLEVVKEFLAEDLRYLNQRGWREKTALMYATGNCHVAVCQYLINTGAEIDCQDRQGITPLMRACNLAHEETIHLLINAGAQLNIKDIHGHNAMYYLIRAQYTKDRTGAKINCTAEHKLHLARILLKHDMPITSAMVNLAHETEQLRLANLLHDYVIFALAREHPGKVHLRI